ncbi:MAG: hypothetical protein ACI9LE_002027, partial [Paraglaciecola sp.]
SRSDIFVNQRHASSLQTNSPISSMSHRCLYV